MRTLTCRSSPPRSTAISMRRATSSPASATPATACTAPSRSSRAGRAPASGQPLLFLERQSQRDQFLAERLGVGEVDAVHAELAGSHNVGLAVVDKDAHFRRKAVALAEHPVEPRIGLHQPLEPGDDNAVELFEE